MLRKTREGVRFPVTLGLLGILCLMLLATGCTRASEELAGGGETDQDGPAELGKVSFRMKWVPYGNYAGDVVGEKWGIWKKHGLDVKVHPAGPGIFSTQMVAGGSDNFGSTGPDEFAVAVARGLPLVAIAAEMQITPIGYLVHPDSGIFHPRDFEGKRFKVIPGHNSYFEYLIFLKMYGMDRTKITEITNKTAFQLWLAHKVDIEPIYNNLHTTQADFRGYPYRLIRSMDFGIKNYGNVLFTTKDFAEKNPEAVKAFIKGFFEAWEATWADPSRAIDTVMEYDPSLIKEEEMEIAMEIKPYIVRGDGRFGWMDRDRWQEQLDMFFEAGVIEKKLTPEDVYTNRFIEEIYGKPTPEKPLSELVLPAFEGNGKNKQ
jgi:NitT/TauT family transport system substrate-binding protein